MDCADEGTGAWLLRALNPAVFAFRQLRCNEEGLKIRVSNTRRNIQ